MKIKYFNLEDSSSSRLVKIQPKCRVKHLPIVDHHQSNKN